MPRKQTRMYGDGKQAHHPDEAGKFSGKAAKNLPPAKAHFEAAMKFLKQHENMDANKIAALDIISVAASCCKWLA